VFELPTSTASQLTANITSLFADPGTFSVIVLVAGLPLAFWVVRKLIGLIPKTR